MGLHFFTFDAKKRKKTALYLGTCCIFSFFFYNAPVIQQSFASLFFKEVAVTKRQPTSLNFLCMSINAPPPTTLQNRVATYDMRGASTYYWYIVGGAEYPLRTQSYIFPVVPPNCDEKTLEKAYYLPLYPAWSVANRDMPDAKFIKNFQLSLLWLAGLLLGCFIVFKPEVLKFLNKPIRLGRS